MYKGWGGSGVRIADFISFFLNIPCKCLSETKLFHFHGIFKNEFKQPPSGSAIGHMFWLTKNINLKLGTRYLLYSCHYMYLCVCLCSWVDFSSCHSKVCLFACCLFDCLFVPLFVCLFLCLSACLFCFDSLRLSQRLWSCQGGQFT